MEFTRHTAAKDTNWNSLAFLTQTNIGRANRCPGCLTRGYGPESAPFPLTPHFIRKSLRRPATSMAINNQQPCENCSNHVRRTRQTVVGDPVGRRRAEQSCEHAWSRINARCATDRRRSIRHQRPDPTGTPPETKNGTRACALVPFPFGGAEGTRTPDPLNPEESSPPLEKS